MAKKRATGNELASLPRRKVRYWLYRFKTEAEGGVPAEGAPSGLQEYFERQTWFTAWPLFAEFWDVSETNPLEIVPLKESHAEQWQKEVLRSAKPWPEG